MTRVPEVPAGRDLNRAPVWLQDYVYVLRQRLQEAHDKIDALNGAEVTDTQARDYSHGPQYLGNGRQVRFYTDPAYAADDAYHGCVDVGLRDDDGQGRFVAVTSNGGRMLVEPWASNVIRVRVLDR